MGVEKKFRGTGTIKCLQIKMWIVLLVVFILVVMTCHLFFMPMIDKWVQYNHRFFEVYCDRLFSDAVRTRIVYPVFRIDGPNLKVSLVPNWYNMDALTYCMREKSFGRKVIFIDTEPTACRDVLTTAEPSVIISTKLDVLEEPTGTKDVRVYLPTFVEQLSLHMKDYRSLSEKMKPRARPSDFCVFAYSNCDEKWSGVKLRRQFYQRLQERSGQRVTNLGTCYSEDSSRRKGGHGSNDKTFQNFKFVVAFENELSRGYVSEKLVNAMLAGAIPIYLGAPDVYEYFNPLSFVDVRKFEDFDACIEYVLFLDENDGEYDKIQNQPWMTQEQLQRNRDIFLFADRDLFHARLFRELLANGQIDLVDCMRVNAAVVDCGVTFLTFADGKLRTCDEVLGSAKKSHYFHNSTALDSSLPFLKNHLCFVEQSKKGYGYWIWKPASILQTLTEIPEGDLLVYSDSGSEVLPFYASDVYRWYEMLLRGGKEMLVAEVPFLEHEWTKMDAIREFLPEADSENVEVLLASSGLRLVGQIGTSVLLMKNTQDVRRLVRDWMNLAVQGSYSLIDDSPSVAPNHPKFRNHRHDQSLFSLLLKFRFPSHKVQTLGNLKYSPWKGLDQASWVSY